MSVGLASTFPALAAVSAGDGANLALRGTILGSLGPQLSLAQWLRLSQEYRVLSVEDICAAAMQRKQMLRITLPAQAKSDSKDKVEAHLGFVDRLLRCAFSSGVKVTLDVGNIGSNDEDEDYEDEGLSRCESEATPLLLAVAVRICTTCSR